jgi:hypothetical protein
VDVIIDKYKARFIVKRFKQQKSVDYFDTHLSVLIINLIKILIVIATISKIEIHQMV